MRRGVQVNEIYIILIKLIGKNLLSAILSDRRFFDSIEGFDALDDRTKVLCIPIALSNQGHHMVNNIMSLFVLVGLTSLSGTFKGPHRPKWLKKPAQGGEGRSHVDVDSDEECNGDEDSEAEADRDEASSSTATVLRQTSDKGGPRSAGAPAAVDATSVLVCRPGTPSGWCKGIKFFMHISFLFRANSLEGEQQRAQVQAFSSSPFAMTVTNYISSLKRDDEGVFTGREITSIEVINGQSS